MKLTPQDIARWTGGAVEGALQQATEVELTQVIVDSRQLAEPGSLFVAIEGPRFDGHDFVEQAFEHGATAALVHREDVDFLGEHQNRVIIRVDDTLKALQTLAATWRQQFSIPVVGITGSNGKTIVKDMLASILGRNQTVFRSPGSYNSQVGVPLAILGITAEHEVAIIEAGISQIGEMERLEEIISPSCGMVTNIGLAHAAGLHDRKTTASEKQKLFRRTAGPVVISADEEYLSLEMFHVKPITVGGQSGSDVEVRNVESHDRGFSFEVSWDEKTIALSLDLPGRHNVQNAAMAAAMARELGADDQAIIDGLEAYSLREMRLEMHTTGADITLINDAYNADPASVRAALGVLAKYGGTQRRVAILGDMLDLGSRSEKEHREIGSYVARLDVDHLFCVGALARAIGDGARNAGMAEEAVEFFDDLDDFNDLHQRLEETLAAGDVVLFKASRSVGLDRAARRLIESVGPTRLFIDLEAISHNFHSLRKHLGDEVQVMAVVKSFAYGSDATRISQTLIQEGVDALAVAFPDEAIPLRQKGLTVPILVTNARAEEADKLVKYDLEALIYTEDVARALAKQARRRKKTVGVHLNVDTGMHRAGLYPDELADFAALVDQWPSLTISGVMTHLASADDKSQDDFTALQISRFQNALDEMRARGIDSGVVHAANTATAWRFPEARFDMVRVGLGLYGLHPSRAVEEIATPVRPVLRFSTRVLHVHQIEPGETVGYGRTWKATGARKLATLAAGYNDGFPRFLSNRGHVLINERRCPLVGSICMDVAVVDITDAGPVEVGDEAVLFGSQGTSSIHVDEWASMGGTISYELLCNISPRVRRIFVR